MAVPGYPVPSSPPGSTAEARGWGKAWPDHCTEQGALQKTITLSNGVRLTVRQEIAELVANLLNYCLRRGYKIRQADTGGYNCRAIRNSNPPRPSNHSWGLAIDVNWSTNVQYTVRTDIPQWMVSLFYAYGFFWGGWYDRGYEDPMHFEFTKRPADVAALTVKSRTLLEEIMSEAETNALAHNGTSIIGAFVQGRTTAPQRDWQGAGIGAAAPPISLPMVTTINDIRTVVGQILEQIEAPAPVEVDPTALAVALRPIIKEEIERALARRDVVAPETE